MKKNKIVVAGVIMAFLMLLTIPSAVVADWGSQIYMAGYYGGGYWGGEDPLSPNGVAIVAANHPEDAALDNWVAMVYAMETMTPDPINAGQFIWNIRVAISSNYGSTFSTFLWINPNTNFQQNYPDVQIFEDQARGGAPKMVVTWQEMPADGSNAWAIKARERTLTTGVMSFVLSVSNPTDTNNDNIYPKVSACSDSTNLDSFWNVVWQRQYNWGGTSTYGIKMRRHIDDGTTINFNSIINIAIPTSDWDYKHPATDCLTTTNCLEVYVVYDAYQISSSLDAIYMEHGNPGGNPWGAYSTTNSFLQANPIALSFPPPPGGSGDFTIGYLDIAVADQTDGAGYTVDIVWMQHNGYNIDVWYSRSNSNPTSFPNSFIIENNMGSMALRSVAVDMFIDSSTQVYKCVVAYSNGNNIYYRENNGGGGVWNGFSQRINGATTQYTENFVDVAVNLSPVPNLLYMHAVWQVDNTAVFYGRA